VKLELTEPQQITLRDVLTTAGLSVRQIEDIFLLLSFKRERVQLAFYYRAQGMTYRKIGSVLGVTEQAAFKMIKNECKNIAVYLRGSVNFYDDSVPTYIDG